MRLNPLISEPHTSATVVILKMAKRYQYPGDLFNWTSDYKYKWRCKLCGHHNMMSRRYSLNLRCVKCNCLFTSTTQPADITGVSDGKKLQGSVYGQSL